MDENCPRYFHDEGAEFNPTLIPAPDLCATCVKNDAGDPEEDVLCNLTRADQQDEEVFLCFAYQPSSPAVNREEVLRSLCEQAGMEYTDDSCVPGEDYERPIYF